MSKLATVPAARQPQQPDRGVTPAMVAGLAGRFARDIRAQVDIARELTARGVIGPGAADVLLDLAAAAEYGPLPGTPAPPLSGLAAALAGLDDAVTGWEADDNLDRIAREIESETADVPCPFEE